MQTFMKTIVQMGIFMICAQVLIHFRPNGSYEKYMKLLVSAMIVAQIFFPLINFVIGGEYHMEEQVARFEEQLQKSMQEAQAAAGQTEAILNEMTLEQLRQQLAAREAEAQAAKEQEVQDDKEDREKEVQEDRMQEEKQEKFREEVQIDKIQIEIGESGQDGS